MAIYNLEETPNLFITPQFYENKFVYRMVQIDKEDSRRVVRTIDLRKDKLMVYGAEIGESLLQRLHDSLILRPKVGIVHVNCDGACYFLVAGKGSYRSRHNVIFDWSPFGVIIPNSVNDNLKKRVDEKEKEINQLNDRLSTAEAEVFSSRAALESSKKGVKELEGQLSTFTKERKDMEADLKKMNDQLSSVNSELVSAKAELESTNEVLKDLGEELSSLKSECEDNEVELQKVRDQYFSANSELETTKAQLKSSNTKVSKLEDQLLSLSNEYQDTKEELQKVRKQHHSVTSELESTKAQLESSKNFVYQNDNSKCIIM